MQHLTIIDQERTPDNGHPSAAVVFVAGLISENSQRTMRSALRSLVPLISAESDDVSQFPWHLIRAEHAQTIRAALVRKMTSEGLSASTVNTRLAALRGVLREAWVLGIASRDEMERAAHALRSVPNNARPIGRYIEAHEMASMMATCGHDETSVRDNAMLAIMYACGLRRAELVALRPNSIDGGMFAVFGKGRKWRDVPIGSAAGPLNQWIAIRSGRNDHLFYSLSNSNHGDVLRPNAINRMVKRRAALAMVGDIAPHDFRRTYISNLLDAGVDIATVSKLAGHSDINTTARYDRRGRGVLMAAGNAISLPVPLPSDVPLDAEHGSQLARASVAVARSEAHVPTVGFARRKHC